jgi:nickel-type superoxide dismutase maturation protease
MEPLLEDRDEVLIDPRASVQPGDIVVARHPYRSDVHLIKVVQRVEPGGALWLEGLNSSQSTDSRTLGALAHSLILGRVTSRF